MAGLGKESPIIEGPPVNSNGVNRFADDPIPKGTFCFLCPSVCIKCHISYSWGYCSLHRVGMAEKGGCREMMH